MSPRELAIVARNIVRVMRDSTRLGDIIETGAIVSRGRLRAVAGELERTPEGRRLLAERPELNTRTVDLARLARLPEGTLGRLFADHLARYGLNLDKLSVPPPRAGEPVEDYLLRRFRGNHDLWHALLGLGTEGHEEVLVHAFSWGQLRLPISALVMLFGGLKHFVLEGRVQELRETVRAHVLLGRRAVQLLPVSWEDLWERPLGEVQRRLGLSATPAR
jgi:ubiquinone biosynthesis protein COQ4